jgi:hypothetical protein
MAPKPTTDIAVIDAPAMALAPVDPASTALAVFDDPNDTRGREGIQPEDHEPPRLSVCQNTSKQKDEGNQKFIRGLAEGDLFHSLNETIYGPGPLEFVVVRTVTHAKQFDENRKCIDHDVPLDDPRLQFTTGKDGKRVNPVATKFLDYLVYLPSTGESALLSFTNSKIKVAKRLNSFLDTGTGPTWKRSYFLSVVKERNDRGIFYNYSVNAGNPITQAVKIAAEQLYARFEGRSIKAQSVEPESTVEQSDVPF